MKTAEEWRHEAYIAERSGDVMAVDDFIRRVQRDAFDAGAYAALRDVAKQGCLDFVLPHVQTMPERP